MVLSLQTLNKQHLAITPQLRQSVEILQMSSYDLMDFLSEQINENPVLDIDYHDRQYSNLHAIRMKASNNPDWWQNVNHHPAYPCLETVLLEQLIDLDLDQTTLQVCSFIMGSLDENGYLKIEKESIAKKLGVTSTLLDRAIQMIQRLEPKGLAASSLEECLLLQLDEETPEHLLIRRLIESDLAELARHKYAPLAKKYDVEMVEIQQAMMKISQLHPKPAANYDSRETHYIRPDLILKKIDRTYDIQFNPASFPSLSIHPEYLDLSKKIKDKAVGDYLKKGWTKAKWLIDSMEYRKSMLLQIAKVIFAKQQAYCEYGPSHLFPLSMRQVAEEIGIHESTVSRAVDQKYIVTPWGTNELKQFFCASVKQTEGHSVSSLQIKERIRHIMDNEDKKHPLSDNKIADELKKEGITASRRVITKYRVQLNILTAAERKLVSN